MDPSSPKAALRAAIRAARRRRAEDLPARARAARALAEAAFGLVASLPTQSETRTGTPIGAPTGAPEGAPAGAPARWRVAAYESMRTEPPTEALRERLRAAGHEVLLPVVTGPRELAWRLDGTDEPCCGSDGLATCDVVFTPGLSVDAAGLRLGQGGGFYDAALAHVRAGVPVLTLLWDEEFVTGPLPAEAHDRRVDAVLTPGRGVIRLSPWAPGAARRS